MRPLPCFQNGNLQNKSLGIFAGNPRQIFLEFFRAGIIRNFFEPPVPPILQPKNQPRITQNFDKKSFADFSRKLFALISRERGIIFAYTPPNWREDAFGMDEARPERIRYKTP